MFYIRNLAFLIFFLPAFYSLGQSTAKYSNEFLSIGVGGRSLAMSNSVIASSANASAGYWNPANLAGISSHMQFGLMHAEYFAGIAKYDFGGVAYRINNESSFGVSLIRFGVDNIPNTLELIDAEGNLRYDRIKSFSVADYAFIFSYGTKIPVKGFRVGGNVKIIRRIAGEFASAVGFGLDASATYNKDNFKAAIVLRDITTTFNAWKFETDKLREAFILTGNEIPENSTEITLPRIILGTGYLFNLAKDFSVYPELNIDITTDRKRNVLIKSNPVSIDPHAGLEFSYKKIIYLRGGIGNIQKETGAGNKTTTSFQPNMGAGVRIRNFTIDYALTDIGNQSIAPYSNIFSLTLTIDRKKTPGM